MAGILNMIATAFKAAVSTGDAFFNLVTLLLNTTATNGAQNNTFLDSSTNNFSITRNGNTTQGTFTPFSQTGWGNNFNGTTAYLSLAASTDWQWPSTSWTVEMWVYNITNTNYTGRTAPIQIQNGSATADINDWSFGTDGNGKASFYYWIGSGPESVVGSTTIPLNTWTHVAATYDGTSVIKIYVNGVLDATGAKTGTPTTSTKNLIIGAGNGAYYNGYISNLRRVVGSVVYTSNFTPSTTPLTAITNTQILTCQSNRFIDNSVNAYPLTIGGTPSVQAFSPFLPTAAYDAAVVGGSGYFDGSGDYLTAPNNAVFDFGSGDFTIEFWVYSNGDNEYMPVEKTINGQYGSWYLQVTSGSLNWNCSSTGSSNDMFNNVNVGAVPIYAWTHIAIVRNGTTFTGYINGVGTSLGTNSSAIYNSSYGITVGAHNGTSSYDLNGYIAGLRLIKGTAAYTSNFTPPTAPPTAITNTSLLLNFTNSGIFDSAAKNVLETVGNAQVSTTQAKWGTTSMYFDGTGDSLKGKLNNAIGGGDYTIEGWLYTGASGARYVFDMRETSQYLGAFTVGTTLYVNIGTTLDIVATTSYPQNTWVHFAMVRSGSASNNTSIFLGGSRVTQVTDTTNYSIVPTLYVGNDNTSSYSWDGYIDDFRITKGYARYSGSTYTPPAAAFPLQ